MINRQIILAVIVAVAAVGLGLGVGPAITQYAHADNGINIHGNYNPNCIHHCGGDGGGNGEFR